MAALEAAYLLIGEGVDLRHVGGIVRQNVGVSVVESMG